MREGALAQAQLDAGQIREARSTIVDAIKQRDDIPDLHILRGKIELAAGSPASAFASFSNALSLDASNGDALMAVAQIGMQTGYLRESEDAADRILTLDPKQPNALLIKGLHNFNKHRFTDALANAEAILANAPNDEGGGILKTRTLALLQRPDDAIAWAETMRKNVGETRGITVTLLELYRRQGNAPAMITQLEQLRKLQPDPVLDIDEADTLYKLGETARARGILQALILRKGTDERLVEVATRLWKQYDPTPIDANALTQIVAKADASTKLAIARYFLDLNDPARADLVLRGAPASDDIVALRARIGIAQGRVDEGLASASVILGKDQTHCDALLAKAEGDLAKRRPDDAITASQLAVANCPQLVPGYLVLARARELDGSKEGADIAFRDAFNRNDQDPDLTRTYAAWLERNGQGRRAVAIAKRLTSNTPSLLSGWTLYRELCTRLANSECTAEAEAGLAEARKRFGIDPRTGERPPPGLFGRLNRE